MKGSMLLMDYKELGLSALILYFPRAFYQVKVAKKEKTKEKLKMLDANIIAANAITDLAESTAKSLFKRVKDLIIDTSNKLEIEFGEAFEEYLEYSIGVYSKTKTLLYKHTPKDIYSFFECVGVSREGKANVDTSDINNILKVGNKIILTGTGGIGKSVMMKHFFLNTIKNTELVPLIVELRGLNNVESDNINLIDYIYNSMTKLKLRVKKEYFEYSLEIGCYVILLDGYDEVKNNISNDVSQQILDLSNQYPNNYYIISSRPLQEFVGWNQFEELKALPLSKKQALSLIQKLDYDDSIKAKFLKELNCGLYEKYQTFASNPLLLTIMLMTFENRMSIPDKLNDFFDQAFTALFHAHDATKSGFSREIHSKLGYEDFKTVFAHFCFKSFFNSDYKFSEGKILDYLNETKKKRIIDTNFDPSKYLKDLTNSVCVIIHDGLDYSFSHRAFQEYFAAVYTMQLDDNQQKKFIKMWLTEENYRSTSSYLEMLYELQSTRFIKNIINPALNEMKKKYEEQGRKDIWILEELVGGVFVRGTNKKQNLGAYVLNMYYHLMISWACEIFHYNDNDREDANKKSVLMNTIMELYPEDAKVGVSITTMINDGYEKELIEGLEWIIDRFKFAINSFNNEDNSMKKKTLSSMLTEL